MTAKPVVPFISSHGRLIATVVVDVDNFTTPGWPDTPGLGDLADALSTITTHRLGYSTFVSAWPPGSHGGMLYVPRDVVEVVADALVALHGGADPAPVAAAAAIVGSVARWIEDASTRMARRERAVRALPIVATALSATLAPLGVNQ